MYRCLYLVSLRTYSLQPINPYTVLQETSYENLLYTLPLVLIDYHLISPLPDTLFKTPIILTVAQFGLVKMLELYIPSSEYIISCNFLHPNGKLYIPRLFNRSSCWVRRISYLIDTSNKANVNAALFSFISSKIVSPTSISDFKVRCCF